MSARRIPFTRSRRLPRSRRVPMCSARNRWRPHRTNAARWSTPPGRRSGSVRSPIAIAATPWCADCGGQADILGRLARRSSGAATIMALSPGHPNHIAVSMDGAAGGFDWLQEQPNNFVERRLGQKTIRERDPERLQPGDRWTAMVPAGHPEGYLDAFRNVIAESWRAMREGKGDFPTFAAGLRGIEIVEAAIKSVDGRRPVSASTVAFYDAYPFGPLRPKRRPNGRRGTALEKRLGPGQAEREIA